MSTDKLPTLSRDSTDIGRYSPDNESTLRQLNNTAFDIAEKTERQGGEPSIVPKLLLRTPMWVDPSVATKHGTMQRSYVDLVRGRPVGHNVEVQNVLKGHAGGVLRYMDLDILMALSTGLAKYGTTEFEVEQRHLLHLMGYNDLTKAPYTRLHAAIKRLKTAQIAIYQQNTPQDQIAPFQLIEGFSERKHRSGKGGSQTWSIRLHDIWMEALQSDTEWQLVDMAAYSHLTRTFRRQGLARVIYLFLSSWRHNDGTFNIPYFALVQRYGRRHTDGTLMYIDPANPNCVVHKALKTLHQSGIIQFQESTALTKERIRLKGQFIPDAVPLGGGKQLYLFSSDMFDGVLEKKPHLQQQEDRPNLPAPKAGKTAQAEEPEREEDPLEERYRQIWEHLVKKHQVRIPRNLVNEAMEAGATYENLMTLAAVVDARDNVRSASGFIASLMRSWIASPDDIRDWTVETGSQQVRDWQQSDFREHLKDLWRIFSGQSGKAGGDA